MNDVGRHEQKSFAGKGIFPFKYAFTLLIPLRNLIFSPKTLMARLDLADDQQVLEIGPGPGYFSLHVAKTLKNGRLVLLDIQQEMLDYSQKRLEKRKICNVEYRQCDGTRFELESDRFDRIFMVTVIGEIENKSDYLNEIHRTLKDCGMLSITELAGDPDKMSSEELQALVCSHGFTLSKVFGNKRNFTLNFTKVLT